MKKKSFYEEILLFLLESSKGKLKENIRILIENMDTIENESLSKQVLGYIKSVCSGKLEISSILKNLNNNLHISIESIEVVIKKLQEIKRNIPKEPNSEFLLKVIDLTLGFLIKFARERDEDYELSCQMIKIISNV